MLPTQNTHNMCININNNIKQCYLFRLTMLIINMYSVQRDYQSIHSISLCHPAIKTIKKKKNSSLIAGCCKGMQRKTNFDQPLTCSLTVQSTKYSIFTFFS